MAFEIEGLCKLLHHGHEALIRICLELRVS